MKKPGPRLPPLMPSEVERIDGAVPVQVFGGDVLVPTVRV